MIDRDTFLAVAPVPGARPKGIGSMSPSSTAVHGGRHDAKACDIRVANAGGIHSCMTNFGVICLNQLIIYQYCFSLVGRVRLGLGCVVG